MTWILPIDIDMIQGIFVETKFERKHKHCLGRHHYVYNNFFACFGTITTI